MKRRSTWQPYRRQSSEVASLLITARNTMTLEYCLHAPRSGCGTIVHEGSNRFTNLSIVEHVCNEIISAFHEGVVVATIPSWFQQLKWSVVANVAAMNKARSSIPDFPGCYVFMEFAEAPRPGHVLYVGQASTSLRQRLAIYLVDVRTQKAKERHKGKAFVLEARHIHSDQGVYLQWVEYGGNKHDIDILEASLINYLNPAANDREDDARHPLLGFRDRLHSDLLC